MSAIHKHEGGIASLESGEEKPVAIPLEESEDLQALAAGGHVATDQYVSCACHSSSCIEVKLVDAKVLLAHTCLKFFELQGRPLVIFDPKAEAKLRLKIDLYIIPTVAILYLFCFIDVSSFDVEQQQLRMLRTR